MTKFKERVLTDKGRIVGLRYFRKYLILVDVEDGTSHSPESLNVMDETNNPPNHERVKSGRMREAQNNSKD